MYIKVDRAKLILEIFALYSKIIQIIMLKVKNIINVNFNDTYTCNLHRKNI